MFTKKDFIAAVEKETNIIKHLIEKVPADAQHTKPTEKQRTILELVTYLSYAVGGGVETVLTGSGEGVFEKHVALSAGLTLETAAARLDLQLATIREMVESATDDMLAQQVSLWGMPPAPKGVLLVTLPLAWMYAYKTQLFTTIKIAGNENMGTMNLWAGMDQM
jgi:hypothetical protein